MSTMYYVQCFSNPCVNMPYSHVPVEVGILHLLAAEVGMQLVGPLAGTLVAQTFLDLRSERERESEKNG